MLEIYPGLELIVLLGTRKARAADTRGGTATILKTTVKLPCHKFQNIPEITGRYSPEIARPTEIPLATPERSADKFNRQDQQRIKTQLHLRSRLRP
jgi:hypothetical protein